MKSKFLYFLLLIVAFFTGILYSKKYLLIPKTSLNDPLIVLTKKNVEENGDIDKKSPQTTQNIPNTSSEVLSLNNTEDAKLSADENLPSETKYQWNVLNGDLNPTSSAGITPDSILQYSTKIHEVFKPDPFTHPDEDNFGMIRSSVVDIDKFLEEQACNNPAMDEISLSRREKSLFFKTLDRSTFEGEVKIFNKEKIILLNGKIEFSANGESIEILDDKGNIFEKRHTSYSGSHSMWRYGSCKNSIIALSTFCPWNNNYQFEFKDLYYVENLKKLIGNIYCRRTIDDTWTLLGSLVLNEK